jgi:hypothetical protein
MGRAVNIGGNTSNDFLTGGTFNDVNGDLTLNIINQSDVIVNLDGRYALSGDTGDVNTDDYVTGVMFNPSSGNLTLSRLSGGTVVENLDGRYLTGFTDTNDYAITGIVTGNTLTLTRLSGGTIDIDVSSLTGGGNPEGYNVTGTVSGGDVVVTIGDPTRTLITINDDTENITIGDIGSGSGWLDIDVANNEVLLQSYPDFIINNAPDTSLVTKGWVNNQLAAPNFADIVAEHPNNGLDLINGNVSLELTGDNDRFFFRINDSAVQDGRAQTQMDAFVSFISFEKSNASFTNTEKAELRLERGSVDGDVDWSLLKTRINGTGGDEGIFYNAQDGLTITSADGIISIDGLPVYADNAAALVGGLVATNLYRTATGDLKIVV